jgi:hypothetical protein
MASESCRLIPIQIYVNDPTGGLAPQAAEVVTWRKETVQRFFRDP